MKKIYLLGILATIMLAGCSSAKTAESTSASADTSAVESKADESTTSASENKTTFTVGFDQDFPPMGFVGDQISAYIMGCKGYGAYIGKY